MENSFKKNYDKKVNPDGSIQLSFKSKRFALHSLPMFPMLLMMIMLVIFTVSCAASYPFIPTHRGPYGGQEVNLLTWVVAAGVLTLLITIFGSIAVLDVKDVVTIKPGEGLLFREKSLPFADVSVIGVTNLTGGGAYVHAESNGHEVKITRNISLELANQINREIKSASGVTWL